MSYERIDYWREAVECALDEAGVSATPEQIRDIAEAIEGSADNIGQAFYVPSSPLLGENERLRRELRTEREKVVCGECKGTGETVSYGPYHSAISSCFKCRGEGKVSP